MSMMKLCVNRQKLFADKRSHQELPVKAAITYQSMIERDDAEPLSPGSDPWRVIDPLQSYSTPCDIDGIIHSKELPMEPREVSVGLPGDLVIDRRR